MIQKEKKKNSARRQQEEEDCAADLLVSNVKPAMLEGQRSCRKADTDINGGLEQRSSNSGSNRRNQMKGMCGNTWCVVAVSYGER